MTRIGIAFSKGARRALREGVSILALISATVPVHAQEPTTVPPITVTDTVPQAAPASPFASGSLAAEGSEAAGYRPDTVSAVGPLGRMPILDVPYSVNVMSSALIENELVPQASELLNINPFAQPVFPSNSSSPTIVNIRGFTPTGGNQGGHVIDGIRVEWLAPLSLEDKERVEVWTGLTSFMYGPGNVGGLINYVYKRPTDNPMANLTIGDYGGLSGFVHGDFGGPLTIPGVQDGVFTYRLNIVEQDGNTEVDGQRIARQLVTAAVDWHVSENLKMGILLSHEYQDNIGYSATWIPAVNPNGTIAFNYQAVPNPRKTYTMPFDTFATNADRAEWNITWKLNDIFTYRSAYYFSNNYQKSMIITLPENLVSSGQYDALQLRAPGTGSKVNAGYSLFDASFYTWDVAHKVTAGFMEINWPFRPALAAMLLQMSQVSTSIIQLLFLSQTRPHLPLIQGRAIHSSYLGKLMLLSVMTSNSINICLHL